jgi:putative transposase
MGEGRGRLVSSSDKQMALELIDTSHSKGCRFKIACDDMGIDFKTYLRWKNRAEDLRRGPKNGPPNKLTAEEKVEILNVSKSTEFVDSSPWIIVSKLADRGTYIASESSFYKVLKENKMLSHRGNSQPKTNNRPQALTATSPNEVWSWDITYLPTTIKGQYYFLYMILDIFSRKIVGYNVQEKESSEHAAKLIEDSCHLEKIEKNQLTLHSDNGSPMKGATMLAMLEKLHVAASFSRPSVSDDNPYSESLFKTAKYCPFYPKHFDNIQEARHWAIKFVNWYNNLQHSRIKYVTPLERHEGRDIEILRKRKVVYEEVKLKKPNRWNNRETRNWDWIPEVKLNNLKDNKKLDKVVT